MKPQSEPSRLQGTNPVLIAGAGPVGLTAALELARFGVPSTVVDREPGLRNMGSRGIVLERATLEVFERIRALEILQRGLVPQRRRTFFRGTELFNVPFPQPGAGELPRFVNLQQDVTERVLLETAQQSGLIDIRWEHEVVGLEQDERGVRLTVKNPTREETLQSRFALACDGCRSPLRKLLGADFPGYTDTSSFLIADVEGDIFDAKEHHFTFDPTNGEGQTQLVVPQPDGIWRIDWQLFEGQDPVTESQPAALEAKLRRTLPEDRAAKLVWSSVYKFHQRLMDQLVHGRVLFAGDSAHLVAPFGARGMNSGIQDAENAAWKIAAVLQGLSPDALVDTYHTERHAAGLENQAVTRRTMAFISPQTQELRDQRDDILRRSVDDADIRANVDSGRMSEPFQYRDSPIVSGTHSLVGSRLRDIGLPEGYRLRNMMGCRPIVLSFSESRPAAGGADVKVMGTSQAGLEAFGVQRGQCIVVRPDGHIAAVTDAAGLDTAVRTAMGDNLL